MAFQGILQDKTGQPIPDGAYTVSFRLYDAPSDGNLLWVEAIKTVTVTGGKGQFATALGSLSPLSLPFDKPYYLEVQISGEAAPMTPRLPLQSVPYALGNWSLTGNTGTNPAADFLGTTDHQPLVLKANSHRVVQYQNVEQVLPELVTADQDGYKAVNYQGVVPVLVEAVKTLKQQNERPGLPPFDG